MSRADGGIVELGPGHSSISQATSSSCLSHAQSLPPAWPLVCWELRQTGGCVYTGVGLTTGYRVYGLVRDPGMCLDFYHSPATTGLDTASLCQAGPLVTRCL